VALSDSQAKIVPLRRLGSAPAEMSDEALLAACGAGEGTALGALFDRHHRAVFRFLSRITFGDESDVEDLVQTTFLEVWKSARRYDGRGSARGFVFGVATNLARHYVRSEVRKRAALEDWMQRPTGLGQRPDQVAEERQLVDRLAHALSDLPHHLREAFVLCDLEEIPGVEAARALGVRQGTMWRRLHDARQALRRALGGNS
jgi:RNA polymerase sigma-70 factor (ECF subfamily)